MKSIFFTNSFWSLPSLLKLFDLKELGGIAILASKESQLLELKQFAEAMNVPLLVLDESRIYQSVKEFVEEKQISSAYCLGFPKKFEKRTLELFPEGILNFHFGQLPIYAGPDPLFWVLRRGEKSIHVICHRMDEYLDAGHLIKEQVVSIYPGENYGLLGARLSQTAADMIPNLEKAKESHPHRKLPLNSKPLKRPTFEDLTIDWKSQSSEDIENLVNASNPVYGGAASIFGQGYVRILEVSPAMVRDTAVLSPGSVVHASPENGLFVLCADYKYLKINVLKTPESILSGGKLAALGVTKGARFGRITNRSVVDSNLIL